jgi:catechol 2,3-dioxygenase-like lactoylglutathione lyase family enzyme
MSWIQDHVHLRCSNYEATVRFLVENLDAKEEGRVTNPGGSVTVTLRIAGSLYKVSPKKPGDTAGPHAELPHHEVYHLGFETDDLSAELAKMKARCTKVTQDLVQVNPQLQYAFIEGPDGISIELLQKGK